MRFAVLTTTLSLAAVAVSTVVPAISAFTNETHLEARQNKAVKYVWAYQDESHAPQTIEAPGHCVSSSTGAPIIKIDAKINCDLYELEHCKTGGGYGVYKNQQWYFNAHYWNPKKFDTVRSFVCKCNEDVVSLHEGCQ
ncbi:hypothetical protein H2203_008455 [Taxawa tesnikishii (nom. ined.)]|nr:hypothetical protein H2203_008455 [Dothideales sp. JES 119]